MILTFLRAYGGHLAIAALLLFGLWKVDQNGYRRAKAQAEATERARADMEKRINTKIEGAIGEGVEKIDARVSRQLGAIDHEERTIVQPVIQREILRDPRLSDPGHALSDELLDALNRANCASHPPAHECHR